MEHKIIKLFLENGNKPLSGAQVIKLLKCDFKTGYKYLAEMTHLNLLCKKEVGKSYTYTFTNTYHPFVAMSQQKRLVKALKQSEVSSVNIALKRVKSPLFIALLFGSRAKGTHTSTSDVDLCIIADEKTQKEVALQIDLLPFKTHVLTFTQTEFMQMLSVRKENVAHEIMKNNVIFHGIDSFYWMVNNDN